MIDKVFPFSAGFENTPFRVKQGTQTRLALYHHHGNTRKYPYFTQLVLLDLFIVFIHQMST
jgi:hypothetical protein